jgi:hypothetical protein
MTRFLFAALASFFPLLNIAQEAYWQQKADYIIDVKLDHNSHQFEGNQTVTYTNNSPDELTKVFFHLYFNAFQPGSSMDVRSRSISDPDPRIGARIAELNESEIGFHKMNSITQDGKDVDFVIEGTVMTVTLNGPISPGKSTEFELKYSSQIPVQVRRSGRNNVEGIDYTMTQWYPKLAEYDKDGWHTDPYVSREFHGVFSSYKVSVELDDSYVIGGTGKLDKKDTGSKPGTTEWQFSADNVHDFAWAADPDFVVSSVKVSDGPKLFFYHLNDSAINDKWNRLEPKTIELFEIMNAKFGKYPYSQFSVIQGGDGGMEYPMCTMISGTGSFGGLVSVTVHEAIHNWYYGVIATNELKYPWMDEGFTTYAQNFVLDSLRKKHSYNPHSRSYSGYVSYVTQNNEEPLTTHADHYWHNKGYGNAAYSKGCIFLNQLRYIIGDESFDTAILEYYDLWKFKHPTPLDFKRVLERNSGIELDWYFETWLGTTNQIDYAITGVVPDGNKTLVKLEKLGEMSMPLEVLVETKSKKLLYYIPVERMRGGLNANNRTTETPWPWVYSNYNLKIDFAIKDIIAITIDPNLMMADIDRSQNVYPKVVDAIESED